MSGIAAVYFRASRASGRTTSMIDSFKTGDRVIFASVMEADRVRRLFKEDGKDVECIVVSPNTPERLLERGTNQGRTVFDHSWVEEFYLLAIDSCTKNIEFFQREMSGYGESHRKTRQKALEYAKWRTWLKNK